MPALRCLAVLPMYKLSQKTGMLRLNIRDRQSSSGSPTTRARHIHHLMLRSTSLTPLVYSWASPPGSTISSTLRCHDRVLNSGMIWCACARHFLHESRPPCQRTPIYLFRLSQIVNLQERATFHSYSQGIFITVETGSTSPEISCHYYH